MKKMATITVTLQDGTTKKFSTQKESEGWFFSKEVQVAYKGGFGGNTEVARASNLETLGEELKEIFDAKNVTIEM